jgi:hypothetical protein
LWPSPALALDTGLGTAFYVTLSDRPTAPALDAVKFTAGVRKHGHYGSARSVVDVKPSAAKNVFAKEGRP